METFTDVHRVTPLEWLEAEICQGAANLTAAEASWLALVAEFDRRRGWEVWECASCAAWLSWQVGLDMRAAREKVRVAHALAEFPLLAAAMARGELSYSKVRAITRIVTPATESDLLAIALAGTSNHVERIVSAYRRGERAAEDGEDRAFRERSLYADTLGDTMEITVRVPVEAGKALLAAIERFVGTDGDEPLAARRADALVDMAEHAVAHADAPTGGDERYLVTLHLDPEVITGGPGCCTVAGGDGLADTPTAVPVTSARRILCDAAMESLLDDGDGNQMRLGRRSRVVRRRLRRAVRLRDGGCRFPGCTRRGWLDAHHIIHWLDGGLTDLENLLSLCRFHHRRVHEGGWTIHGDTTGTLTFLDPTGRTIIGTPPVARGDATAVAAHHRSATDGRCQWGGEHLDMNLAIGGLQHAETIAANPGPRFPGSAGRPTATGS